jgi:predicted RNA-binding Zn ribbon-like protein
MNFQFIGGNLAIDFANTVVAFDGKQFDLISSPEKLLAWFNAAKMPLEKKLTPAEYSTAITLRNTIRSVLQDHYKGNQPSPEKISCINDHLIAKRQATLKILGDGSFTLTSQPQTWQANRAFAEITYEITEVLVNASRASLKMCAANDCILYFRDISRSGRRRWCSMETCGNRAKVAAHYQRTKQV